MKINKIRKKSNLEKRYNLLEKNIFSSKNKHIFASKNPSFKPNNIKPKKK